MYISSQALTNSLAAHHATNLINFELVKHLTSQRLLSEKQYGLRFSISNADVLKNIAERICLI